MRNRNPNSQEKRTKCWGFFSCCGSSDDEKKAEESLLKYQKLMSSKPKFISKSQPKTYKNQLADWWSGKNNKEKRKKADEEKRSNLASKYGIQR